MTKRLLMGVSVLALSTLGATGAWANPENIFSAGGENYVYSTAYTVVGNALSESFNTNQNSISYQDLYAYSDGNYVSSGGYFGSASVNSGNATVSGGSTTSGISVVSANSGNGSVVQQGVSLAALGTVNVR